MSEENKMKEVVEEIKGATEDDIKKVINKHFENVRTQGMKIGAQYISIAIMSKIEKHLNKPGKSSLRDYERCIADIKKLLSVQLTQQNDSEEISEEITNDGTAE